MAMRVPEAFAVQLPGYKRLRGKQLLEVNQAARCYRDTRGAPPGWQNAKKLGSERARVGRDSASWGADR